jgi:hypothetical protein
MHDADVGAAPPAIRMDLRAIFVSLEMSRSNCREHLGLAGEEPAQALSRPTSSPPSWRAPLPSSRQATAAAARPATVSRR